MALAFALVAVGGVRPLAAGEAEYTIDDAGVFRLTATNDATRVVIPSGVRIIAARFEFWETLEEVVFPEDSLIEILGSAFWGYTGLTHVEIPDSVTNIHAFAFNDCTGLKAVKLPKELKVIREGTFRGCSRLNDIALPDSVVEIEEDAFSGCTSLCRVFGQESVEGVFETYKKTAFRNCPECIEFIPVLTTTNALAWVEVPLDPNGGELETASLRTICAHNYGLLPTPQREGYVFDGWWTARDGGDMVVSTSKVPSRKSAVGKLYAHWAPDDAAVFATGGDGKWTEGGNGEWRTGNIAGGESTWLQLTVSGAGRISFDWTTLQRNPYYVMTFFVDDEQRAEIAGEKNWTSVEYDVSSSGEHVFRWVFEKGEDLGATDANYGLVSNIVWGAAAQSVMVALPDDATPQDVTNAVNAAGFADPCVAGLIGGDKAKYSAFREWANGVDGGASAVVASQYAAASYILGATGLFAQQPLLEISRCSYERGDNPAFSLTIAFKDGEEPRDVTAECVAQLFELTRDLRDWEGGRVDGFGVAPATPGAAATHSFRVMLPGDAGGTVFLRIRAGE